MNLLALDIETECAVEGCGKPSCEHSLLPSKSRITCVGVWSPKEQFVFRDLEKLKSFLKTKQDATLVGHHLKFDLKHLHFKGVTITNDWHDTQMMAATVTEKVPQEWLDSYERRRVEANKSLKRGYSHRKAKGLSLKTLAPYFLGVKPFWENPENHNDDTYVLKDCEYTFRLFEVLAEKLKQEDSWTFYNNRYRQWAKTLLNSELRGVKLDMDLLNLQQSTSEAKALELQGELDQQWQEAYKIYYNLQVSDLRARYDEMAVKAIERLKDKSKASTTRARYEKSFEAAREKLDTKLNLNSPDQVLWLLKDHFKLDVEVRVRDKDTNVVEEKDSTGTEVLHRLAKQGRGDIQKFLDYREQNKLATAFFPTYRELQVNGSIHCNFNLAGTRTGRLSADSPNLQQCPGDLHRLFVARPGYKIASFDMSAIEARMIAYYSEDPVLYQMIRDGTDIHGFHTTIFFELDCDASEVKSKFKNLRDITKNIGFGLFYGAGANRIQQEAMRNGFKWSEEECREKARRFKETYEGVTEFKKYIDKEAERGMVIRNVLGRPFYFPNQDEIFMKCFNTLIQSSASDLVLNSAHKIQQEFKAKGIDGHVLLLVHDEIVTEIPEDRVEECQEIIIRNMTSYDLQTALGPIKLDVEGAVESYWKK